MWYFTWVLGLFAAAIFAVVNAMWLELQQDNALFVRTNGAEGRRDQKARGDG